jgi:hypothetical protein
MSTISLEPGVVVCRGLPIRQRSGLRVEVAAPLVAIALRHLAAEFDDLATLRHLNEDTARAEPSQSVCERLVPPLNIALPPRRSATMRRISVT